MGNQYNDPRWITAKYPGTCNRCGRAIGKGAKAFYYPNGRRILCDGDECGGQGSRDFNAAAFDEMVYNS